MSATIRKNYAASDTRTTIHPLSPEDSAAIAAPFQVVNSLWRDASHLGCSRTQSSHCLDHLHQHGLSVAINHVAVVGLEQCVDDAGVAFAMAPLDDINLLRLVGIQDGHTRKSENSCRHAPPD